MIGLSSTQVYPGNTSAGKGNVNPDPQTNTSMCKGSPALTQGLTTVNRGEDARKISLIIIQRETLPLPSN